MKSKSFYKNLVLMAAVVGGIGKIHAEEANIYIVPDEAHCLYSKSQKTMRCIDNEGKPINGIIHKYKENQLIREYPVKNGLIEGTAVAHYTNGEIMMEKPYTAGKLNGEVKSYDKDGKLVKITPYINGKKEGVEKHYAEEGFLQEQMVIINGKLNGPAKLYDKDGNTIINLTYAQNRIANGLCYYKDKEKIISRNLSAKEVSALNKGKQIPAKTLGEGDCAFE